MAVNEENGARFFTQALGDSTLIEEPIEAIDTVVDELGEFVRSITGTAQPETGGAQGLAVVAVLDAAVASRESGRAEPVVVTG
jgi:predicted dehydrogenase